MDKSNEQRKERRLCYNWPIRFFNDLRGTHLPGRLVDVSSEGMAFICNADDHCPQKGQEINARFSVPRFGEDGLVNQVIFTQKGQTYRIDEVSKSLRRVAVQFAKQLFFKPGEQGVKESVMQEELEAVGV
jgi:hypothetical protein